MKSCTDCGKPKPPSAFYRDSGGRKAKCIQCVIRVQKRRRASTRTTAVPEPEPSRPEIPNILDGHPDNCPRCGGILRYEPLFARCLWGCARLWVLANGSRAQQVRYETISGLRASVGSL